MYDKWIKKANSKILTCIRLFLNYATETMVTYQSTKRLKSKNFTILSRNSGIYTFYLDKSKIFTIYNTAKTLQTAGETKIFSEIFKKEELPDIVEMVLDEIIEYISNKIIEIDIKKKEKYNITRKKINTLLKQKKK